jgi:hypothetical protein
MTKVLEKKDVDKLITRWKAGGKGLEINERVFVLEKLMRKFLKEQESNSHR